MDNRCNEYKLKNKTARDEGWGRKQKGVIQLNNNSIYKYGDTKNSGEKKLENWRKKQLKKRRRDQKI